MFIESQSTANRLYYKYFGNLIIIKYYKNYILSQILGKLTPANSKRTFQSVFKLQ